MLINPISKGLYQFNLGLETNKKIGFETGLSRAFYNGQNITLYSDYHYRTSFVLNNYDNPIWGNKIGFTATYLIPTWSIDLCHYTNFKENEITIKPEVGFSFFTIFEVVYGYHIHISQNNLINPHNLTFRINLVKDKN